MAILGNIFRLNRGAIRLGTAQFAALLAVAVPIAYILGRFATALLPNSNWMPWMAGLATVALGALVGIPLGLFFGAIKAQPAIPAVPPPPTTAPQDKILAQIKLELVQNQKLFNSRQGNLDVLTRLDYITAFWSAVQASGQLFVMQDPQLLGAIATAYYWLGQANRLERLAYEAQYLPGPSPDNQNASTHLIAEARLLDGPLGIAIQSAIDAVDNQLMADTGAPAVSRL